MAEPADVRDDRRARTRGPGASGAGAIAPDGTGFGATPLPLVARRIARGVATEHADVVDAEGRFPAETAEALRAAGLLGAAVPSALGGLGAGFGEIAACCYELGQGCANAAMVFAMHQIQVACLVRHAATSSWFDAFLGRVAREQLLIASATTEAGSGGDVRRSACAVVPSGTGIVVEKDGCVISYAGEADAVLTTARRGPDSPAADQVAVLAERRQCALLPTAQGDTLGMRGTCSAGYRLRLEIDSAQVVPAGYADIAAQTMLPVSHILWAALWLGIATAACDKARRVLRRRMAPGAAAPAGSQRLVEALGGLQALRAQVADAVRRYETASGDADRLRSIAFTMAMNQLKLSVSAGAIGIVGQAMGVAGLSGYRNGGPDSIGRHLRDVHSAALMINNDRILAHCAGMLGGHRGEQDLLS